MIIIGLDNGIIIRGKSLRAKQLMETMFKELKNEWQPKDFEFAYWRKCFNIRNRMLLVLDDKDYDGEGGEINLTTPDLYDIVENVLKYFLDEDKWENPDALTRESIWTWSEMIPHLGHQIYDIRNFLNEFKEGNFAEDEFEIIFYDSY